jgi:7-cyano-7-deazaguanine synthase
MDAILVLSGGQDSTTCGYWTKEQGYTIHAVTFDYGQRHRRELEAAGVIAKLLGIDHEIIKIGPILKSTSPLVSNNSLEQYADPQSLPGGIEKTFIPMRNQLFLTLAYNRAAALGAQAIVTGVCQEDYGGYPDCREVFIDAIAHASNLAYFGDEKMMDGDYIPIHTPLMNMTKAAAVHMALAMDGCYEALAYTHTSYDGSSVPTGHDHATLLRAKGFMEAGVPDPLVLRCVWNGDMQLPDSQNYRPHTADKYIQRLTPFFQKMRTEYGL